MKFMITYFTLALVVIISHLVRPTLQNDIRNFFSPESSFNILIYGDSISQDYPKFLKAILKNKLSSKSINVVEKISPEAKLKDILPTLEYDLKLYKPKIVIAMLERGETKSFTFSQVSKPLVSSENKGNQDDSDESSSYLQKIMGKKANDIGARLIKEGRHNRAILYYKSVLSKNPNSHEINSILGDLHIQLKDYQNARKYILNTIKIDPTDSAAYAALAWTHQAQNNFKEALRISLEAAKRFKRSVSLSERITSIYVSLGNIKKYNKYLKSTLKILEDNYNNSINKDFSLVKILNLFHNFNSENIYKKKFDHYLNKLKNSSHLQKTFHQVQARHLIRTEKYSDAQSQLKESLKIASENSQILIYDESQVLRIIAHTAERIGDYEQSLSYAKKSLLVNPREWASYETLTQSTRALNNFKESISFLEELAYSNTDNSILLTILSFMYFEIKEYKKSYFFAKQAQYLNKNNSNITKHLFRLSKFLKLDTIKKHNLKFKPFLTNFRLTESEVSQYNRFKKIVLNGKRRLVIMQYPDKPLSDLSKTINRSNHNKIYFIDNHAVLLNSKRDNNIALSYDWDLRHLSKHGSTSIAKNLANFIVENKLLE